MTGQSHFMLIFLIPKGQFTKSHQLRKVTLVDFDCRLLTRWPLFCKSLLPYLWNLADLLYFIMLKIVYLLKIMVHCILIIHVAEKLCCEWTTLFTLIVADTQRRLIPHSSLIKDKKEKIRQTNFHCTVYTGTTWNDFAESHRLRTMNARGHINSVPWMTGVTPTPYHECTQFVDSVKPLSFRPIHGTELVWPRSFIVRSWCDFVKWPYGGQKSA